MTLGSAADGAVFEFPTTAELIDNSYVVARGRFTGAPDIVWTSPEDGGVVHHLVVWEFVPDEVYRDVRAADAPAKVAEERRGSILVAASVNDVGASRDGMSVADFVHKRPSMSNLNSFPVDRPVYVFLSPGVMPGDVIARDGDLAHVMVLSAPAHCYLVDDLDESCAYVADDPGGKPVAELAEGALVPDDLSTAAVKGAGEATEVVEVPSASEAAPIDVQEYTVLPDGGGEG